MSQIRPLPGIHEAPPLAPVLQEPSVVRWVVFDIGGVLTRVRATWGECAAAAGVEDIEPSFASMAVADFEHFGAYQQGRMSTLEYLRLLSRDLGGLSIEQAGKIHDAILAEPTRGTDVIIATLNGMGVGTACLSNTNSRHWRIMTATSRYPSVEALRLRIASHEIGVAKPMREVYEAFEAQSGARPEQIVYFEDHPEYVEVARERGWEAILVEPGVEAADQIEAVLTAKGIGA